MSGMVAVEWAETAGGLYGRYREGRDLSARRRLALDRSGRLGRAGGGGCSEGSSARIR